MRASVVMVVGKERTGHGFTASVAGAEAFRPTDVGLCIMNKSRGPHLGPEL